MTYNVFFGNVKKAGEGPNVLLNPSFEDWISKRPVDWQIGIGGDSESSWALRLIL